MNAAHHISDELLSTHVDSALSADDDAAVSAHLFGCAECSGKLELLRATSLAVSGLPEQVPPRALDLGFLGADLAAVEPERPRSRAVIKPARRSWVSLLLDYHAPQWAFAGAGAAAVLLVAVSVPGLVGGFRGAATTAGNHNFSGGLGTTQSGPRAAGVPSGLADKAPGGGAPAPALGALAPTEALDGATPPAVRDLPQIGVTLTLAAAVSQARAGDQVLIQVTVSGDPGGGRLSAGRIELYARYGSADHFLAGTNSGAQTVAAGESRSLRYSWIAGSVPDRAAAVPGTYVLVARVYDGNQARLDVVLPITVR